MTNYLAAIVATGALATGACSAAETPAAAAKPVSAQSAPAATSMTAPRYVQVGAGSGLTFTFEQAGAASKGSFRQFTTVLAYDDKNPAAGGLEVTVQTASVDTEDKDRNDTLVGADLLDAQKFPTARFVAHGFTKRTDGSLEAAGKLTLRGVTRDLRLPIKIVTTPTGLDLSGAAAIKRLDYGVGQGDWKATDSVADEVKLQYKVALVKAK